MLKNITKTFINIFLIVFVVSISACQVARFIFYNYSNITDHKIFPAHTLIAPSSKFTFINSSTGKFPKQIENSKKETVPFDKFLEETKSVAFLIIKNDSIQYEKYFNGYDDKSIVASFSMAKSFTSILIGCAIQDGFIKSEDELMVNYIPELKENGLEKITIKHLLQMTSGINFNESYVNPFGDAATFYYGRDLRKSISKMKPQIEAGTKFNYISGNTQLLGLVLERSLKGKTITNYLQEKLWQPLGMEFDASWSIDKKKEGLEKTFCCLNARARDFAKIGRLYLKKGNWNGKQLVPQNWVEKSIKADTTNGGARNYKYQWWLPTKNGDFMADGHLGQYIYVNPAKNLIIVRLGKKSGNANWRKIFISLAQFY